MVEIAAIFRLHGPASRATCGDRMLPSHLRAMQDMERCRTELLGGQVSHCETCQEYHDRDHSCKNRHCPTCQQDQAKPWLEHQTRLLLPVPHCMVTCTLPAELRGLARRHQKTLDHILFRSSSEALQALALDPRFIGGRIGMVGVLQSLDPRSALPSPRA
ncbi:MAG: IS91 family transposase [Candidatus Entotheonellia bacterium]